MTFTLTCMAGELSRALSLCAQVSGHEKMVPILTATEIVASAEAATLSATNTDHGIRVTIAAEGDGTAYIPTRLIQQKAAVLRPGQPVTLAGEGNSVTMSQGRTRWKMPMLLGTAFPQFVRPLDQVEPVAIARAPFMRALAMAGEGITQSLGHPIYMGALLDMKTGFHVIGTDRHRFVAIGLDLARLAETVILPTAAMAALASIFREDDELSVAVDRNAVTVEAGGVFYRTKLIEGEYLDWRMATGRAVPLMNASVTVDREAFLESLKRAASIAENVGTDAKALAVRLVFDGNECAFSCNNKTNEEGQDFCEALGDGGGDVIVSIEYLRAMAGTIDADQMRIDFSANDASRQTPLMLYAEGKRETDFRFVMPMRG